VDPVTRNDQGDVRFAVVGRGVNTHLSKMISSKTELAFRYAFVIPDEATETFQDRIDETILGYTHYLNGHRIKLQANIGYRWLEGLSQVENARNSWTGLVQVEFGI
jgi:hypothetical protein